MRNIDQMFDKLDNVSLSSVIDFEEKSGLILDSVNTKISRIPYVFDLIGENSLEKVFINNSNSISLVINALKLKDYSILSNILPWVYKTYNSQGFSWDFWPMIYDLWKECISEFVENQTAAEVLKVYDVMKEYHSDLIEASKIEGEIDFEFRNDWKDLQNVFLDKLIQGDHRELLKISKERVKDIKALRDFYLGLIQPVMYKIGGKWQRGDITVSEEHLATSVVGRLMAALYPVLITTEYNYDKRVIVTSSPNEFHELGGRMLSDLLESEGWDVSYLGANNPPEEVIKTMETNGGFADLSKHIEAEKIITPKDWEEEKDVFLGATFNLGHQVSQMLIFRPHNKLEGYKNLYLVGGGTHPGSGLPTIYESGKITADLISQEE